MQEVGSALFKYYLPEPLLALLVSHGSEETLFASLDTSQEMESSLIISNDCTTTLQVSDRAVGDISGSEVVRVLRSYEVKLLGVSVWGLVRSFVTAAQRTLHYGAHWHPTHHQIPVRCLVFLLNSFQIGIFR